MASTDLDQSEISSIVLIDNSQTLLYAKSNKIYLKYLHFGTATIPSNILAPSPYLGQKHAFEIDAPNLPKYHTFNQISIPFAITTLSYLEDGVLIAGAIDGSVRLWDLKFGNINTAFERKFAKFVDKGKCPVMLIDNFCDIGLGKVVLICGFGRGSRRLVTLSVNFFFFLKLHQANVALFLPFISTFFAYIQI